MIDYIIKGYKIRLYPNKQQEELINKNFGCCRFIYNYFLNYKKKLWEEEKKSVSKFDLMKKTRFVKTARRL